MNDAGKESAKAHFVGGVPQAKWKDAPSLSDVVKAVSTTVRNCILVGHGLPGDLTKLGLKHPGCLYPLTTPPPPPPAPPNHHHHVFGRCRERTHRRMHAWAETMVYFC